MTTTASDEQRQMTTRCVASCASYYTSVYVVFFLKNSWCINSPVSDEFELLIVNLSHKWIVSAIFSALTLLAGLQEGRPVCY